MATAQGDTLQQLLGSIAGQTSGDNLTQASTAQQIAQVGPELAQSQAYSQALGGYSTEQYGITQAQNALSQQGNAEQYAQGQAQQGFEEQNYGLQQQAFGLQNTGQQEAHTQALQGISTSGTASNTLNTVGQGRNVSNQNQSFALNQALLGNSENQAAVGQAAEQSGYNYNQQQISNAGQNLKYIAQANGVSQQQALTMLGYGQQQAGQGAQTDLLQLLGQYGSGASADAANVGSTLSQIGFAGGINTLAR